MLQLIIGRAGSGKTEYVFHDIQKRVSNGERDILLITPEQFSFLAQKRLLTDLGEQHFNCVESTSFTRLVQEISSRYGGDCLPVISKGAKAIMMKRAIEAVQDHLVLFHSNLTSASFINSVLRIYDEFKSCRVTTQALLEAADEADRELLQFKLKDIALITDAYDALIQNRYYDSADELTRLYHKLLKLDYFKGRTAYIDGFAGFVAQEYKILEVILQQADSVYITFCTDSFLPKVKTDLFAYVNQNIGILKEVADKIGVPIMPPVLLKENYRAENEELRCLESNIFSAVKTPFEGDCSRVKLYCAKSLSDECEQTAFEISRLLREGLRASDITVICRNMEQYEQSLAYAFDKYRVPYFRDERQSIQSQPLVMFVNFLLRTLIYSYRSEDIFSMLKTGLTALRPTQIHALENYVYLWSVNGSKWKNNFSQSTKGYVAEISATDRELLDAVNESREYAISRIRAFQRKIRHATAAEMCRALFDTLLAFSVDTKLKELAMALDADGKTALAEEQGRIWDMLMDILDSIALTSEDHEISVREFSKLFHLMITNEDLGTLPMGLDNVQLGQADRIRCNNPAAVFLLGANEGEFPQAVASSGLLTETDRLSLMQHDFKLYSYGEALGAQEKYFAYTALSAATRNVFVSYRGSGENATPSAIVRELKSVFPLLETQYAADSLSLDRLESDRNAFDLLASHFEEKSELISSLEDYFARHPSYERKLSAVRRLTADCDMRIKNAQLAEQLFHKDMYLSASRIEDYYNCAFRYFCKFGLHARPRLKAQLDPMQTGTVIHYVLEQIIKQHGNPALLDSPAIRMLVNRYLTEYLNTQMGDSEAFTPRFKYQFMRLSKMLFSVVERLREEFSQSDFEARAFELKIGEGEAVKSKHICLPDCGSVEIKGAVDRVDTYTKDGIQYVRVVDYKSGTKEFALCDILNGLNLQMFVYLFTLSSSDSEYAGVPGGVLYMHSGRKLFSFDRNKSIQDQLKGEENKLYQMKGVVLNDEAHPLAEHMEHKLEGKYIPVQVKRDGLTGNIVTLEELGQLSDKIDSLIAHMGMQLHGGFIPQNPINGKNHEHTCAFCDYNAVCMNQRDVKKREMLELSFKDALQKIKEETDESMD